MVKSIGIIGGGVVGQAVKHFFQGKTSVRVYDKYQKLDGWEDTIAQGIIFICVPTPFNNGIDLGAVHETFHKMAGFTDKIAVIKSTVIIGTTDTIQSVYPGLKILFNPEFLNNNTAIEDFANPDKQLVGYTPRSLDVAQEIMDILPQGKYNKIVPAKIAESVKYMVNSYYANKVIFANQIYDICQAAGVDYNGVREAFEHDKRVAPGNFDVWHGGFRGYAGKCLPKDVSALLEFATNHGVDLSLIQAVHNINNKLLQSKEAKEPNGSQKK